MKKTITFLTLIFLNSNLFAQEDSLFLSCGTCEKYCDPLGELAGMPNRLVIINDLPKSSSNGKTSGKVFGVGASWYDWMEATIWYDPMRISIKYKMPSEHDNLDNSKLFDFTIERSTMSYGYDSDEVCLIKSKQELENTAVEITTILMRQTKL